MTDISNERKVELLQEEILSLNATIEDYENKIKYIRESVNVLRAV